VVKSSLRLGVGLSVLALFGSFCVGGVASANENRTAPLGSTACAQFTSQSVDWPTATGIATFTTGAICYVELTTTAATQTWIVPTDVYKIDTLAAGGGGGGATGYSGGGGGGQVKQSTHSVKPGMTMHIDIGAGGGGGNPGYGLDNALKPSITATTQLGTGGSAGTHSLVWWLTTGTTRITVSAEGGSGSQPGINQMGAPGTSKVYGGSVYTTYAGGYAEAFMYTPTPAPPAIPGSTGVHPMKAKPYGSGGGPGGAGSRGNGNNSDNSGSTTRHGGQGGPGSELLTSETTALMVGGGGSGGSGYDPTYTGKVTWHPGTGTTYTGIVVGNTSLSATVPSGIVPPFSGDGGAGGGGTNGAYSPAMAGGAGAAGVVVFRFHVPASLCTPTVDEVTPSSGPASGGALVTLFGSCLTAVVKVTFGTSASVTSSTPTWLYATTGLAITFKTPAHAPGVEAIQVQKTGTSSWIDITQSYEFLSTAPHAQSAGSRLATTPTGSGWWEVHNDGGVFTYGTATFFGSLPSVHVSVSDIAGIAATCDGEGYWLAGSDGGVFAFGDAQFFGSLPLDHVTPNQPIVGIEPTSDCEGYYLVAADGGIFAFGDAVFQGSLPFSHITASNIVGISISSDGYLIVGDDGGVFAFGTAEFYGSLPSSRVSVHDILGIAPDLTNNGYYLVGSDGGVFAFGTAKFYGSQGGETLTSTPVGLIVPVPSVCSASVGNVCASPQKPVSTIYRIVNETGVATNYRD